MSAADVVEVISRLEAAGISFWLDGGWGVDALLGEQTRPHDDLDGVVRLDEADAITEALSPLGFAMSLDNRPTRFVLADAHNHRVDFHPVVFNADSSARHIGAGTNGGDAPYPADGFSGEGSVGGRAVHCLTTQLLVRHHLGHPPKAKDWHNVRHLCERFGFPIPDSYKPFAEIEETR
ncbi:MAG TPA: amino acid transporter [Dehalococcoidia bacterium]